MLPCYLSHRKMGKSWKQLPDKTSVLWKRLGGRYARARTDPCPCGGTGEGVRDFVHPFSFPTFLPSCSPLLDLTGASSTSHSLVPSAAPSRSHT